MEKGGWVSMVRSFLSFRYIHSIRVFSLLARKVLGVGFLLLDTRFL